MRNAVTLPRQRCISSFSPLDLILATTTAPRPHEIAPPQSLLSQPPPQVVTTATLRDTEQPLRCPLTQKDDPEQIPTLGEASAELVAM